MKVLRPLASLGFALAILVSVCAISLSSPNRASAQTVGVCDPAIPGNCMKPNADGSITTSAGGTFSPISPSVGLTATSVTSNIAITGGGTVLELTNNGTVQVNATLGPTNAVTASATSPIIIPAGQTVPVPIGANSWLAVFAASGSNPVVAVSGTGAGYANGGGGPSSGSNASVGTVGSTAPTGATLLGASDGTNLQGASPTHPLPVYSLVPPGGTALTGSASGTGAGAVTLFSAAGAGVKNWVLGLECWNTSAVTVTLTLSDSASTQIIVPQTFGNTISFPVGVPLSTATNTALTYTPSAAETTLGCAVQGYKL